jgi:hypothetical protein
LRFRIESATASDTVSDHDLLYLRAQMMKMGMTVLLCCCTLAANATASGNVFVSNLAETNTVNFNITSFAHASSFLTDDADYVLDWVTLDVHSNTNSGFAQVKIRSDSGGVPGAVLEDLGIFNITSGGSTLQTLTSSGISLLPNTRYWITAGETGDGSASWKGTTSTTEVSPGTWTIGDDDYLSDDGGLSWQPTSFGPPNESSLFSVNATANILPPVEVGFVDISFSNPVINSGPLSFGLSVFPEDLAATLSLAEGFPTGGGATGYGLAEVISASLIFGDGVFTTLSAFDMEVLADGSIETLSYTFAPISTPSVSDGIIILNSPLFVSGTDIASGQAFSYTYGNSVETFTPVLEGDLDADGFVGINDLNIVLGNWNQNVVPDDLLAGDPSGDGFVGIDDLNTVLGNWNAGIPPGDATGTAVPEPGMLGLTVLCLVGPMGRRRR